MKPKFDEMELVRKAQKGDRAAFRELVEKYQQRVYGITFEILRSAQDAEDAAQEAFVKAYLSLGDFKGEASFYTWLYRIAYNMAIDFKRKAVRRSKVIQPVLGKSETNNQDDAQSLDIHANQSIGMINPVEGPQEALLRQEQQTQIRQALEVLSEEHRSVITLREVDGLSYEEIARVTGVSRGTVMSRLHYARKHLQKLLHFLAPPQKSAGTRRNKPVVTSESSGKVDSSAHGGGGKGMEDSPIPRAARGINGDFNITPR